jgi:hypothetical protein
MAAWELREFLEGWVAASPLRFHLPHENSAHAYANDRLPFGNQTRYGFLDLIPIPPGEDALLSVIAHPRPDSQNHRSRE